MRKKLKRFMVVAVFFLMVISMLPNTVLVVEAASKPVLAKNSVSIVIGGTSAIKVKNALKGAKITYKSNKKSIATVSKEGKVKGIKNGTANITVCVKENSKTTNLNFKVIVKKPELSKKKLSLTKGKKINLSIKNKPTKATYSWTSSNSKIVSVSKNGTITAKASGEVIIKVRIKTTKNVFTLKCNVISRESNSNTDVEPTGITLDKNSASIEEDETIVLTATVLPSNATNKNIIWSSSNTSVAAVSNGEVTGISVGTATITAKTFNDKICTCKINVLYKSEQTLDFDKFAQEGAQLIKESGEPSGTNIAEDGEFASKRLIVRGNNTQLDFKQFNPKAVVKSNDGIYLIQFSSVSATKIAFSEISNWPDVVWAEPDTYSDVDAADNVSTAFKSWGVTKIGADKYAASISSIRNDIVVSVVDSGVSNHTFLSGRIQNGGYDFVDNDTNPSDKHYHGTHVAGTIVDCTPGLNVKILPVRVLNEEGRGSSFNVGNGIKYAADHGAKVINLSLSGSHSNYKDENIEYAIKKGVVVVVAAGNNNSNTSYYCPAHLNEAVVVAAVNENDQRASFSNFGNSVDICAPGVGIVSCVPGGSYRVLDGTSMAAPHISAVAAMFKLKDPSMTPIQIEKMIKENARDLGPAGWDKYYGYGIPDLSKLVDIKPAGLILDRSNVSIKEGDTAVLTATIIPDNATNKTVTWSSNNTSVATVSNGKVIGISKGTATITAKTSNGIVDVCAVTVTSADIEPTGITLNESNVSIKAGSNTMLIASVIPSNATNKTVAWSSDSTSVATVSDGKVFGISEGTAIITAKTINGQSASCKVKVLADKVEPTRIILNKNNLTIEEGSTEVLTATVEPYNAKDKTVTWFTNDTSVVTVNDGKVTGKSAGNAVILAETSNGKSDICYVTVVPKCELSLNYSDITLNANNHGSISLFAPDGGKTLSVEEGESVQVGMNVNFYYSHVPGLQLKAYVNGSEISASEVIWSQESNYGYGRVDTNGYVTGDTNGGFVSSSVSPKICEQVITATLKRDPSVSKKIHIIFVYDAKIKFYIENTDIASVDKNGLVTGKRNGMTKLIMESELTGRSTSCTVAVNKPVDAKSELVYKENNQFYTLDCYGNQNYIPVSNSYDFYLKVPLDNEINVGSKLEIAVNYSPNCYAIGVVNWSNQCIYKGGYSYYPLSSSLYHQSGKIRLYYQIILANGQIIHPMKEGSTDCYYLDLY